MWKHFVPGIIIFHTPLPYFQSIILSWFFGESQFLMLNKNYIVLCEVSTTKQTNKQNQLLKWRHVFCFCFSKKLLIKLLKFSVLCPFNKFNKYKKEKIYVVKSTKLTSSMPLFHLRYFPSHLSAVLNNRGWIMLSVLGPVFYSTYSTHFFSEAISISSLITISAPIPFWSVCFIAILMEWPQSWKTRLWTECANTCIL